MNWSMKIGMTEMPMSQNKLGIRQQVFLSNTGNNFSQLSTYFCSQKMHLIVSENVELEKYFLHCLTILLFKQFLSILMHKTFS